MRHSSFVLMTVAVLAAGLTLAACGGGGDSSTSATASARAMTSTTSTSAESGSEASASQRRLAEAALAAFFAARARGAWSAACRYLAAPIRSGVEKFAKLSQAKAKGCGPFLKMASSTGSTSLANPLTRKLDSLRVNGQNGFAIWIGPDGHKYAMPMRNERGAWKVTQPAPLSYPAGNAP